LLVYFELIVRTLGCKEEAVRKFLNFKEMKDYRDVLLKKFNYSLKKFKIN